MWELKNRTNLIIINDSILDNTAGDTYSSFFINNLNSLGYHVSKITIIPSDIRIVSQEIFSANKECDITLILSNLSNGVVGQALGMLFEKKLEKKEQLEQFLNKKNISFKETETMYPACVNVLEGEKYPLIHIQRLFLIDEKYMDSIFRSVLKPYLKKFNEPIAFEKMADIYLNGNSGELENLEYNQVKFQLTKNTDNSVLIEYKSEDLDSLLQFEEALRHLVFISYSKPVLHDSLYLDSNLLVKNAIQVIETCFEKYGPENTFLSFNGGKDCTVLLHITIAVLEKLFPLYSQKLICLYVQEDRPFKEQEEFIDKCQEYFNLELVTLKMNIKEALTIILKDRPNLKACLMGTRKTDPFSQSLLEFQLTDQDYPEVMRVNPLLDWSYYHIWDYLLYYKVPYCMLYNMGYTSLGNIDNTVKNPHLLCKDFFNENEKYLPAYKLLQEGSERIGRNR
ncbi:FAD synthase-like isoform X2 [Harmonia axyridis]|uniref:FAD synthase-like isoform X2 n=1 Tax=Harmonia axyridis TaxID=115357 RepID=UPI001E277D2A|nr:FAD synthase-like isoform X2 [Harmonia axyridis]